MEKPYIIIPLTTEKRQYNPNYGDHKICKCGHPYYRHFDSYEDMRDVGCKYCHCYDFIEIQGMRFQIRKLDNVEPLVETKELDIAIPCAELFSPCLIWDKIMELVVWSSDEYKREMWESYIDWCKERGQFP